MISSEKKFLRILIFKPDMKYPIVDIEKNSLSNALGCDWLKIDTAREKERERTREKQSVY